ncbi:isopentenyl phosphate kinase [Halorussus litoreus]|uniref:isopentenyl phosphate kinase n=1 Tax=Halorussus litoreus TaxID=1710536 RepID=UPI0034A1C719
MTVLKLGGSVVTEKDSPETLDGPALDAAADALADALAGGKVSNLVVVHGAGSFGHHYASQHGVSKTEGSRDATAAVEINRSMKTLNEFVLARLHERDVPAVPVHPFSAAHRDEAASRGEAAETTLPTQQVATMLGEGFVPVLHGDVVAQAGAGVTILSGDEVVVEVAKGVGADRVGFCSSVSGVLDDEGAVIPEINSYEEVADYLGGSDATDVTGGMAGKVRTLLELGAPASIFGPDDLGSFLDGEGPGTRIDGA